MKRVLVLDAGGAMGIIQTSLLVKLEKKTGIKICDYFDLILGSSIGAVAGSVYATGKLSAEEAHNLILSGLQETFKISPITKLLRKINPFKPIYSRDCFVNRFNKELGDGLLMRDCKTKFLCTSDNMVDGETHYFKSWEPKDGSMKIVDAVTRSFAAPVYFGSIPDKENNAVWLDGATGITGTPLIETYIEILRQSWHKEEVSILSLGVGYTSFGMPLEEALKAKDFKQAMFYAKPSSGGLARCQSSKKQTYLLTEISKAFDNIKFQRINKLIDKKLDAMDKIEYCDEYIKIGKEFAKQIDYNLL